MPKIRGRLTGGIILVILLSGVFFGVLHLFNASLIIQQDLSLNLANLHDTALELDEVDQHGTAVIESMMDRKLDKVALAENFLVGSGNAEDWDEWAPVYSDDTKAEMVVKVTEDAVLTDKAAPVDFTLDPEVFSGQKGWFITEAEDASYVIYYFRIGDVSYFISWENYEDSPTGSALQERRDAISGIEKAFGINILRFTLDESGGKKEYIPVYISEEFDPESSIDDFGITEEMLAGATDPKQDSFRESDPLSSREIAASASLDIGEEVYQAFFRTTDGGKTVTVFMFPFRNSVLSSRLR